MATPRPLPRSGMPAKSPGAEAALAPYRAKRRFGQTAEPSGAIVLPAGARYLIQKHDARRLHYDFRLELDGVLLSWAVTRGPSYDPHDKRLAVRTEDHPLDYGNFEGTIPQGQYGGGTVMLWDTGSWEPLGDPHEGLAKGKLAFRLHGKRLHGRWALVRMRPRDREKTENWLLIKERDEFAGTEPDLLDRETSSVQSGRSMPQIAAGAMPAPTAPRAKGDPPAFAPPALATLVEAPPAGKDWLFEIKYDGYRALIAADGEAVRIYTRSGLDWTDRYPAIAAAVAALGLPATLLDGEITVIGRNGVTSFGALVAALEGRSPAPLSCFLFDILVHKAKDVRQQPFTRRRALLQRLLGAPKPEAPLQLSESFSGDGNKLLAAACAHGLEGLIAKRADAPYRPSRHLDWLKIKCRQGQAFVIIGFAPSTKPSRPFSSLLMGVREAGGLRYAGRVGTGFSQDTLGQLAAWRDANRRDDPACPVPALLRRGVVWVKPELVAEIAFADWTQDGLIRQGRFIGLRGDKPATEAREMPKSDAVPHITHPDRAIYPEAGLTKADLAAYVQRAAPLMWPYLKDRFVSLVRCPDGVGPSCFFQRRLAAGFGKAWGEQEVSGAGGKTGRYIYPQSQEALIDAVQMGTLEFHLWGARRDKPDIPDRLVFDLDPDPDLPFAEIRSAAMRLREVLAALGLESLPLLSGGKGIHVVVKLRRQHDFATIKDFCGNIAQRLAADEPARFVATMSKAKRHGRIFIDYFRNEAGATAIAPYSPRARGAASVAWPCRWSALAQYEAADAMTIPRAQEALQTHTDPWAGTEPQSLSAAALRAAAAR
ncbi:MAG TPA: DNA ligase D [Acidocella sp.]|jgi:bifunctional non-homologous end joining protein LigD|uniref:DNA ligase D n=1 Tax=Acidocella sp. TaxID=50710 RepID=UPI002C96A2B7|nr:DNA ligase D [Acidocella sp.]HVE23067.1 DNA ligase D [Acidocella sp.]